MDTEKKISAALEKVASQIDEKELVQAVLDLCNIYCPAGAEEESCDWVYKWMGENGFAPKKVGIVPERYNVVGKLNGTGGGKNLLFSSHLDAAGPKQRGDDHWSWTEAGKERRHWYEAWVDDEGKVQGESVQNDRGPMICFLMAAKAIRDAGIKLKGDVWLTACPGEMGQEPVDEFDGLPYLSKEVGAEYMLTHGGILADYGIAAEGTDFGVSWVEAGKAFFKVTILGQMSYTPFSLHPENLTESTNPIVLSSAYIAALNAWSGEYAERYRYECPGGVIVPKVQIGAIRGGHPTYVIGGTQKCSLYLDCRLTPDMQPQMIAKDLQAMADELGIKVEVEMYVFRPSFEPDHEAVEPFHDLLKEGHKAAFDKELEMAAPAFSSMWRDHMVMNKFGIPSVTYGPTRFSPSVQDLVDCTLAYAAASLATCGIDESE